MYRICPQTLLPVLPHLSSELQAEDETKRTAVTELLGRLFALPGCDMDVAYPELFDGFLRRCSDQKVIII